MALLPFGSPPPKNPGGSTGQIQFNNGGAFGGDSKLVWDNTNKRLGVGITPLQTLDVNGIGMVRGTLGGGETLTVSGAGARMFFYPKKGAFRAGYAVGTEFDDANIGQGSTAVGYQVVASNNYAVAIGAQVNSTDFFTYGIGAYININGGSSVGIGYQITINNGENSDTAIGNNLVIGKAGAYYGANHVLIGSYSNIGLLGGVGGLYGAPFACVAIGYSCGVEAYLGVSIGYDAQADVTSSIALSLGVSVKSSNATNGNVVIGIGDYTGSGGFYLQNSYDGTLGMGINTTAPVFWITAGDGVNPATGNVGVGQTNPTTITDKFQVNGNIKATGYKSSDGSAGMTGTITTASLVGKTATFKNGLLVSFS